MSLPPPVPPPQPYNEPLPVLPLAYPAYAAARPGIITAIGVVSIVVASLSLMGNFAGALNGLIFIGMSRATAQMAAATQAAAQAQAQARVLHASQNSRGVELAVSDDGLKEWQRQIVIDAFDQLRPLNDQRKERLNALLAKTGQNIVMLDDGNFNVRGVKRNVSDSGAMPSARRGYDAGNEPLYFVVGSGKIELYDDHATFFPTNGETVRVARGLEKTPSGLTGAQIDEFIASVKSQVNDRAAPEQLEALRVELTSPQMALLNPPVDSGPPPVTQLRNARIEEDGALTVVTYTASLSIGADGVPQAVVPAGAAFGARVGAGSPVTRAVAAAMLLDAAAGFLLAIYLLVIGILVLRQNRYGRRLHFIYAVVKLLMLAIGVLLLTRLLGQVGQRQFGATWYAVMATIWAVVGAVYPIALLIVLNLKSVREYYHTNVA